MKSLVLSSAFLCATFSGLLAEEEFRVFTNTQGRQVKAKLVSLSGDVATIQMENGQRFPLKLETLSPADQEYIRKNGSSTSGADKLTPEEINAVAGQQVFAQAPLWDSKADEVAQRLGLQPESKTKLQSSFRSYPNESFKLFGARPFSAAMYAAEDKPTGISLVYANKGDLFGAKGSGEMHFDRDEVPKEALEMLAKAMTADVEAITKTLSAKLGEPSKMRFGEGAGRETVQRWDWRGHAILLKEVEAEYVGLEIVTTAFADKGGAADKTSETVIRDRVLANLEKRENGDVVIGDLPMVDQGPKGYCAPATVERAMRHLGLTADMYVLANAGGTKLGGGTSMRALFEGVGRYIRRKGRKFDEWNGEMKIKELAKFIDRGVPVIWGLSSTDEFNDTANKRTEQRKSVTNWAEWKTKVEAEAAASGLRPDDESAHVVLIIGYNKDTNEIAFSDSWGERYKERWISIPEAEKVSQKSFYLVNF
ncbi:MAG: hypothetical protein JNJ83_14305 [Verrucomicrobiaceae bacterium]|nr:hypothetical protein [Verrucomicrobiaceae bacterium]